MESIDQILQELDKVLIDKNRTNYDKLQSPLGNEELKQYLNDLNVHDDSFEKFYKWKNGFNPNGELIGSCQIFDYDTMLPLEWVMEKVEVNKLNAVWNNSFIPIITDSTGQFLLFNNKRDGNYGKIYLYEPSREEPISYYDSLAGMIETTTEAYNQGALKFNEDEDWLDIDVVKFHAIATIINIDSEYWNAKK